MFSAKEIIGKNLMSVIDSQGKIRKSFFWYLDKQDKKKVNKLSKHNAFRYVKDFLPAFGIYKYRDPAVEDGTYLVIQKNGRRVRILGDLKDPLCTDKIFSWTEEALKYLSGIAGDIPHQSLEERLHSCADLFTQWTIRFLPTLPEVESNSNSDGTGKWEKVPQRPLTDSRDQSYVCFENGLVVIRGDREPTLIPYQTLPPEIFIWDSEIRQCEISEETLQLGPHGHWWDFFQNLAKEDRGDAWVVNPGLLQTLVTAYGYLLHNFYPPDLRRAIVFYDRTHLIREGGNGKSIIAKSFNHIKPVHFIDGKRMDGDNLRFMLSGYTPDKKIVVTSDTRQDFKLEDHYNLITDGFTVEKKGKDTVVISEDAAPKLIITTNYTINATERSDRRRLFFAPISTYYGTLDDQTGRSPADEHGGKWLLRKDSWGPEDFTAFYATCVHCIHEYLKEGLIPFKDNVLAERQLLGTTSGDDLLLRELTAFINGVVEGKKEVSRDEVLNFYSYVPELERYQGYKEQWKVRVFKNVAIGLGYQVNPGRPNGRYQKVINGEHIDFYAVLPATQPTNPLKQKEEKEEVVQKELPKGIDPNSPFANFKFGDEEEDS